MELMIKLLFQSSLNAKNTNVASDFRIGRRSQRSHSRLVRRPDATGVFIHRGAGSDLNTPCLLLHYKIQSGISGQVGCERPDADAAVVLKVRGRVYGDDVFPGCAGVAEAGVSLLIPDAVHLHPHAVYVHTPAVIPDCECDIGVYRHAGLSGWGAWVIKDVGPLGVSGLEFAAQVTENQV